ncbi:MAG: hypothetical protein V3U56_08540 [Syntrophobacteria bacterium]|jgi:hypothetical protein
MLRVELPVGAASQPRFCNLNDFYDFYDFNDFYGFYGFYDLIEHMPNEK